MEKLELLTKEIFGVGLKEWRISIVFVDGSDSSFSVYRIVAPDAVEALRILSAQCLGTESEDDFHASFRSESGNPKSIDDLMDDESYTYYISPNWDAKPSEDEDIAIYEIDPFDGALDLIRNYKNKFQWEE